jgi:hypothetical protein
MHVFLKKQSWRQPIQAIETQIHTLVNTALSQLEEIDGAINSAALLAGRLFELNFFTNKINL